MLVEYYVLPHLLVFLCSCLASFSMLSWFCKENNCIFTAELSSYALKGILGYLKIIIL